MSTAEPALAQQVLNLRRAGVTMDAIATRVGVTTAQAKELLTQALADSDPEVAVGLEADRLDRLHLAVWPEAVKGDVQAIDRVLKISERRDKVVATPRRNTHTLREAFDTSAATSEQVHEGWDVALLEAGRKIADRVDEAVASGEGQEVTRALYLVPHMLNVLREMLATPAARAAAQASAPPPPAPEPEGKLASLRAIQGARRSS